MALRSFGGPLAGEDFPDWDAVTRRLREVHAANDGEYQPTDDTVLGDDWTWHEIIRWKARGTTRQPAVGRAPSGSHGADEARQV